MCRTSAMMMVLIVGTGAAHVMVMTLLRRTSIVLITDDPGTEFTELAIHRRLAITHLLDAIAECIQHPGMVPQVERFDKLDLREKMGGRVGLGVDAFDQHTGKQKVRKYDDAGEAEPGGARQGRIDAR